jgi:hypothetical protein
MRRWGSSNGLNRQWLIEIGAGRFVEPDDRGAEVLVLTASTPSCGPAVMLGGVPQMRNDRRELVGVVPAVGCLTSERLSGHGGC